MLSAPVFTSVTRGWGRSEVHCVTTDSGKSLCEESLSWEHGVVCLLGETCLEKSYRDTPKETPHFNSEDGVQ